MPEFGIKGSRFRTLHTEYSVYVERGIVSLVYSALGARSKGSSSSRASRCGVVAFGALDVRIADMPFSTRTVAMNAYRRSLLHHDFFNDNLPERGREGRNEGRYEGAEEATGRIPRIPAAAVYLLDTYQNAS